MLRRRDFKAFFCATLNQVKSKLHQDRRESHGQHSGLQTSFYVLRHDNDPKIDPQQRLVISSANFSDSPETIHSPTASQQSSLMVTQRRGIPVWPQLKCIVFVVKINVNVGSDSLKCVMKQRVSGQIKETESDFTL